MRCRNHSPIAATPTIPAVPPPTVAQSAKRSVWRNSATAALATSPDSVGKKAACTAAKRNSGIRPTVIALTNEPAPARSTGPASIAIASGPALATSCEATVVAASAAIGVGPVDVGESRNQRRAPADRVRTAASRGATTRTSPYETIDPHPIADTRMARPARAPPSMASCDPYRRNRPDPERVPRTRYSTPMAARAAAVTGTREGSPASRAVEIGPRPANCLLYTSDAADE